MNSASLISKSIRILFITAARYRVRLCASRSIAQIVVMRTSAAVLRKKWMSDWRTVYGLAPKVVRRCPECGAEHAGKCSYRRKNGPTQKATAEQARAWLEKRRRDRQRRQIQTLIRELCDGIERARRSIRQQGGFRAVAKDQSRSDSGADLRKAARNTITRNRTSEDGSK